MVVMPHDEICPISEQLLFSLYEAAKGGLPVPVFTKALVERGSPMRSNAP